jgi:hypothetical protein
VNLAVRREISAEEGGSVSPAVPVADSDAPRDIVVTLKLPD